MARSPSFLTLVKRPAVGLAEIDMFFAGRGEVQQTLRRLVKRLQKARIPYAVMGGLAVNAHGHQRLTKDVDVLLSPDGLAAFRRLHVPRDYEPVPGRPRRLVDRKNRGTVDVLLAGRFPGSGKPGPIAFPAPEQVRETIDKVDYLDLLTLIQLKLAARRHQDFADVVNLIAVHDLDESFLDRLHPSVRRDFVECLEEKRREEAYQARDE